ncbi:unnamed protein product [Arabidopsis lyrata]|nr:unnamed protein product [Arabidopsis lyrata]
MSWCQILKLLSTGSVKLGRLRRRVELSRIRNGRKRETNPRTQSKQGTELLLLDCSEKAKSIAAAASSRGKIEITEIKDFAGQEIKVKRLVEADSKKHWTGSSSSVAPSAVDAVLEQI